VNPRGRPPKVVTKPCEFCGKVLTRTGKEVSGRKYWTCDASCASQLSYRLGRVAPALRGGNKVRSPRVTRPCALCGKSITRALTDENRNTNWFCTRDCNALNEKLKPRSKGGDVAICEVCGDSFVRTPKEIQRGRKHCTRKCANAGHRGPLIRVQCAYCGGEKWLRPSEARLFHYCTMECRSLAKIVRPLERVYNGKPARLCKDGYIKIWMPEHPHANKGWVLEHRWLMEQHLGRIIPPEEEVDHKNRIRSDNRLSNLQVLSKPEHRRKTGEDRRIEKQLTEKRLSELEEENALLRARLVSAGLGVV
jgi:hypothetical protein